MFTVKQRNISIVNDSTAMKVESDVDNDNDQVKTRVKIKINKSDIFDKNWRKLKAWLIQIKLYFKFNRVANDEKIFFATMYFREQIKHWIQFMLKNYLNENEKIVTVFFFQIRKKIQTNFQYF